MVGINERDGGSLYNAYLVLGPSGLLHKHRKLMPTQHERLFHGIGAGEDLRVIDTPAGRVGGLICWENRMPLARWAVYQGAPRIWVAPSHGHLVWLSSSEHGGRALAAQLAARRIYVTPGAAWGDDRHVRVALRDGAATDRLVSALRQL